MSDDFASMYLVKTTDYLLVLAFLVMFIPFWRYLNTPRKVRRRGVGEPPSDRVRAVEEAIAAAREARAKDEAGRAAGEAEERD